MFTHSPMFRQALARISGQQKDSTNRLHCVSNYFIMESWLIDKRSTNRMGILMTTARPLSALFADMPSFVRPAHESVMSMNDIIRAVNGRKGRRPLTALKALDRCEEMNLDMDLTKAKVKAFARRLQASSIFTEGDVREVVRMSADRDWCVEDVLSEVRAMLMSAL